MTSCALSTERKCNINIVSDGICDVDCLDANCLNDGEDCTKDAIFYSIRIICYLAGSVLVTLLALVVTVIIFGGHKVTVKDDPIRESDLGLSAGPGWMEETPLPTVRNVKNTQLSMLEDPNLQRTEKNTPLSTITKKPKRKSRIIGKSSRTMQEVSVNEADEETETEAEDEELLLSIKGAASTTASTSVRQKDI